MVFNIYKRSQGKYTRLCSAFAGAIIVTLGCIKLYSKLEGAEVGLWVETMVPAGIFVVLVALCFWLVNKPYVADFFIAAEGEMKKVSWSSKQEIIVSTTVVIVVVIMMACLLGITDLIFSLFFMWLLA